MIVQHEDDMANGTAKETIINKYFSDRSESAGDTWDQLNLDSVFFGLDHIILSYAMETSVSEATANIARMYSSYNSLLEYMDSNVNTCYSDYVNMAKFENDDNEELKDKLTRFHYEASELSGVQEPHKFKKYVKNT